MKELRKSDYVVFSNCAYANSRKLFPDDDIMLLSIGTGRLPNPIKYINSKRFGKIACTTECNVWLEP